MDEKQPPSEEQVDEISQRMSRWQQANPDATLTDMEEAVEVELAQLRKRLVEAMVREKEVTSQEEPDCPHCGQRMVKNGRRQRILKGKEGETIALERQHWRCLSCGATLFPPG
jgi:transposase-like protein